MILMCFRNMSSKDGIQEVKEEMQNLNIKGTAEVNIPRSTTKLAKTCKIETSAILRNFRVGKTRMGQRSLTLKEKRLMFQRR